MDRERSQDPRDQDRDIPRERERVRDGSLNNAEREILLTVGRFRVVPVGDLTDIRFHGSDTARLDAMNYLYRCGLIKKQVYVHGWKPVEKRDGVHYVRSEKKLAYVVLTRKGRAVAMRERGSKDHQPIYSGVARGRDLGHDLQVYRMVETYRQHVEKHGGKVERVMPGEELGRRIAEVRGRTARQGKEAVRAAVLRAARQNDLRPVEGKILVPDARVIYRTGGGSTAQVDLELVNENYARANLAMKAAAGFQMCADGSDGRSPAQEYDVIGEILQL